MQKERLMEDKNKNTEQEENMVHTDGSDGSEQTEEPRRTGIPTRSSIMMCLAGLYLVYTGYRLCQNVLKGVEGGNWGFFAAGAGFLVVGAVMLFIGGKNLLKREKEKKEAAEAERQNNPEPVEEQQEKKPMTIAERARLAGALAEKEEMARNEEESQEAQEKEAEE